MIVVVGLGNPGKEYQHTRHNAGFMAVDHIALKSGLTFKFNKKFNADIAEGVDFLLVKPETFMNDSGKSVQKILAYYKLCPEKTGQTDEKITDLQEILIVVHDDLDIVLGSYKISTDSRSAGHKGVQSIIDYLKTKNFKRIRIGIKASGNEKIPTEAFVLQKFSKEEQDLINKTITDIVSQF